MNKIIIFLIITASFIYAEKIPMEQAQRAAADKISSFYQGAWFLSTNLTYYSENDEVVAYGFVFTNIISSKADDEYKTATTATFETYTDSEQPIILKVYKGLPDVILWQKNIPDTMTFEKYIMISPMVTSIALSSNDIPYYLQNSTIKKVDIKKIDVNAVNVLNNVLPNEKYRKMAKAAWERYKK